MAQAQYCTTTDVQRLLSVGGVALRTDDDANALTDAINEASTEIDFYCFQKYGPNLASSLWVEMRCRVVAAALLCSRRGNPIPEGINWRYEKTIRDLESIQNGRLKIPNLPGQKTSVPVLSNQRAALVPLPRVITEPGRSTGTPEGYTQPQPIFDAYSYLGDDWYL